MKSALQIESIIIIIIIINNNKVFFALGDRDTEETDSIIQGNRFFIWDVGWKITFFNVKRNPLPGYQQSTHTFIVSGLSAPLMNSES